MTNLLIDASNWLRRRFEKGTSIRQCLLEVPASSVVVFDGAHALDKRRSLYPEYKAKREPAPSFFYKSRDLFQDLLQYVDCVSVRVPGYEADDVIATLVDNEDARIWSTDVDFLQLPNVTIDERVKQPLARGQDLRLYKTLVGDPSDNIPGLKGFGKSAWDKLSGLGKQMLIECFEAGEFADRNLQEEIGNSLLRRIYLEVNDLTCYWSIVGFFDVPVDLILKHTVVGQNRPDLIGSKLKEMNVI